MKTQLSWLCISTWRKKDRQKGQNPASSRVAELVLVAGQGTSISIGCLVVNRDSNTDIQGHNDGRDAGLRRAVVWCNGQHAVSESHAGNHLALSHWPRIQ
jgi:hypothetical protein